jgi:hypothetical protein
MLNYLTFAVFNNSDLINLNPCVALSKRLRNVVKPIHEKYDQKA